MKVLSISFWVGIITAVLFFITMLCFAWDDGRMHEKEIKNSIWKYILFLLMGMITSVFTEKASWKRSGGNYKWSKNS